MSYELKFDDIVRFTSAISAETRERGDEVQLRICPRCGGGQHRDEWTFAINSKSGAFKCMRSSCGYSGHFVQLARDYGFKLEFDQPREYRHLKQPTSTIESRPEAIQYLLKRGISEQTVRRYEVTARSDDKRILVFPFRDEGGLLRFIKYRNTAFKKGGKGSKEWCESGAEPILFGMHQATDKGQPLIITEGQIDSLSVAEVGYPNAVSVPIGMNGFGWVSSCWKFIHQFPGIIVMGDHEGGKITLVDGIRKLVKIPVAVVRPEDYLGEKDANDVLTRYGADALRTAIENAGPPEIRNVKDLSEVQPVDIDSLEKIKTGVRNLDRCIGGLTMGQVVLLSGRRGEGKSTFMSQLVAVALNQGFKVFAYSGELASFHFRRTLDFQLAGADEIEEHQNEYGDTVYTLPATTSAQLSAFYKGRAFLYDNEYVGDGDEYESLLETTETVIRQNGVKLVCIDNLMTAMSDQMTDAKADIYTAQSNFVGKLKNLAMKYGICVILVAHPRKTVDGKDLSCDDIAGSGDITNKVDVVLTYTRLTGQTASARLNVLKNRLFGRLIIGEDNGLRLGYSDKTKRIYDDTNRDKPVGSAWKTTPAEAAEEEDLPF